MVLLDTSVLVECLTGPQRSRLTLRRVIERGERCLLPSLVLYEWLRGPRSPEEIAIQEALFPSEDAIPFGPIEAAISAKLYRSLPRPRGRAFDFAIAAYALNHGVALWTLNGGDFRDIPGLQLYDAG